MPMTNMILRSHTKYPFARRYAEICYNMRQADADKRKAYRRVMMYVIIGGCDVSDDESDCLASNPRCPCGLLLSDDDMAQWELDPSKPFMCEGCYDELNDKFKCDDDMD